MKSKTTGGLMPHHIKAPPDLDTSEQRAAKLAIEVARHKTAPDSSRPGC